MIIKIFFSILFLWVNTLSASDLFSPQSQKFLNVKEAFQFSLEQSSKQVTKVNISISNGYYLYKNKFKLKGIERSAYKLEFLSPKIVEDEFFGRQEVFDESTYINIIFLKESIPSQFFLEYQGCAKKGLCYPPNKFEINLKNKLIDTSSQNSFKSQQMEIAEQILSKNILITSILFLGFGILLAFTPCVLPMVPILSGILLKDRKRGSKESIKISLQYVSGLCLVYLLIGILLSVYKQSINIQFIFQDPVILIVFSIILVLLSLSMFGVFNFQMPSMVQNWSNKISSKLNTENSFGIFMMGALSALIVGPCIGPPLAGIFIYITTTNINPWSPPILLLMLSIGMSIPLVIYSAFIGRIIPKTGNWMKYINYFFGVLLILAALILLDRVYNFYPSKISSELDFQKVENLNELKAEIHNPNVNFIMVDVYADWCLECKRMEAYTFKNKQVIEALNKIHLIKIDVTENNKNDQEILNYLKIIGPPSYMFGTSDFGVMHEFNVQGYMGTEDFLNHLKIFNEFNSDN